MKRSSSPGEGVGASFFWKRLRAITIHSKAFTYLSERARRVWMKGQVDGERECE